MLPCQFQLVGRCNKGKACAFSHDPSVCRPGGAGKMCRDFQSSGICKFGDRCVYVHQQAPAVSAEKVYFYGKQGEMNESEIVGMYGEKPAMTTTTPETAAFKPKTWATIARLDQKQIVELGLEEKFQSVQISNKPPAQQNVSTISSTTAAKPAWAPQPPLPTSLPCKFYFSPGGCRLGTACRFSHDTSKLAPEAHCGICFDNLQFKRIGVLTHCEHVFCLACIKGWRSSEMSEFEKTKEVVQTCPICRVRSHFVVPCEKPPSSLEEKEKLIEMYKRNCSEIPCKYEANGAECPFGTSCLFKHRYFDPAKLGLRFAKTADGRDRALAPNVATVGEFLLK